MNKNITLSAEEKLIKQAREKASRENTTLNEQFREWLERYVSSESKTIDFLALMERLSYAESTNGFSRDEFNER